MVATIRKLMVGLNSLEVFQAIVEFNYEISHIRLISHKVCVSGLTHYLPTGEKWYERDDFLNLKLDTLEKIGEDEVWSVNSKVRCDEDPFGDFKHVPMMNFHFEDGVVLDDAIKAINTICGNQNGALLESGRYFHYYGNYLLYHQKWLGFLGQFLMPCVLVSPRYVGHAINDGYCSLRLTADKNFKPKIPTVIKVFN